MNEVMHQLTTFFQWLTYNQEKQFQLLGFPFSCYQPYAKAHMGLLGSSFDKQIKGQWYLLAELYKYTLEHLTQTNHACLMPPIPVLKLQHHQ